MAANKLATMTTVEPPIKDPLRRGQPTLQCPKNMISHMFSNLREEDNLSTKDTLQCPKNMISHSNNTFSNLREEDNLSTMDKVAGPNVGLIIHWDFLLSSIKQSV